MSSPDLTRRAALALLVGLPAACGFAPVYGPDGGGGGGGGGTALRGAIRAAEPDSDIAFAFVRRFEERLGRADAPRYDLAYALATEEVALAITGSNDITRYDIEGRLDWTLTPAGGGKPTLRARETAFTAYSASGSTISTLESQRDAQRRLAIILADKVAARLLAEAAILAP